ncbi:MAG: Surfeit locus 1 family protein [Brevundimonas sp.]|nr:Surfeit locus 1 family protein [Brevundimonas sp.]
MRRFPWILTLFTAPALAFLIGLGVWQVQRLQWKEGLIDQADAAATSAPAAIETVLAAADPEFRKALVVCPGLATARFVELQSIHESGAGSRLISVCRAPGQDKPFLIDRGFISDEVTARPRVAESTMPLSLLVELRRTPKAGGGMTPAPADNRFYARDSAAIAKALGAENPSEFTLFALSSTNPEIAALGASAPPAAFANNHLGYAMTWFGLAIALVGFYLALVWRRMRPEPLKDVS